MFKFDAENTIKKLRNHYRVVLMNEDTYQEVLKFKLSRLSVYIALSSAFVLFTIFAASLIIFTPIKYYLPGVGYGDANQVKAYKLLKIRADSMETSLKHKDAYLENLQNVLQGKITRLDTTKLEIPKE